MAKTPVIGVTLDFQQEGSFSRYPHYALRKSYFDVVIKSGGLPIAIPYSNPEDLERYFKMIDGLLIPGGSFDVPPDMYGETDIHESVQVIRERTEFEYKIAKRCLDENKPVLGICGGMQLLNVVLGGTLIQDIPTQFESKLSHYNINKGVPAHDVEVKKNTKLHGIVKKDRIGVNTAHHQAVKKLGEGLVANAVADDGLVEGFEHPKMKYCIGVQWHPEYVVSEADFKVIEAFVDACR